MTSMAKTKLQEAAGEAYSYFESRMRDNGETYYSLKGDSPTWVSDLVLAAHGVDADGTPSFLPDDYRYKWTMEACEFIAESDDPDDGSGEFADAAVDVYTGARFAWLSSNLQRASYCDEAAENYGHGQTSIVDLIGWGQYAEAEEVYSLVLNFLNDHISD